jgi:hypothetical protein
MQAHNKRLTLFSEEEKEVLYSLPELDETQHGYFCPSPRNSLLTSNTKSVPFVLGKIHITKASKNTFVMSQKFK